ncbi:MAG: Holliday junction resolvase RuvX [Chthoniobacterales bacterium]
MIIAIGIDIGDVRFGVAVSDELGMLAHPLETIDVRKKEPVKRICELIGERRAGTVVVGLPRNMDGSYGAAAEKAREFAEKLRGATECAVVLWDERLTTVAAARALRSSGQKAKQQKPLIDQVAAQHILQGWLDAEAAGAGEFAP